MLTRLHPISRAAVMLMALPMILAIAVDGYANGEPPPLAANEHLTGPATVGTLSMWAADEFVLGVSFTGRCGRFDVTFVGGFPGFSFDRLVGATDPIAQLQGRRFPTNLTPELSQCYSSVLEMMINTVTRFSATATTATADVVILGVMAQ